MIKFNGVDLSNYMKINTIDRGGIIPPRELETLDIPQRVGQYLVNSKTGARVINVGVTIIGVSYEEIRKRLEIIGEILLTNEPEPIIFDDEPDRIYYGMLSGSTNLDERNHVAKGTITFLCPDPYKYGDVQVRQFDGGGQINLLHQTNADIFPTYRIEFNAPSTFFSLMNDYQQITVGNPAAAEQTIVPAKEMILFEGFDSFTGWTATNTAVDYGVVAGAFKVENNNFVPSTFGTGTYERWHGPALMKTLASPLTDFELEVYLENKGSGTTGTATRAKQVGRVELYLFDVNNRMIGKFAIKDAYPEVDKTTGEARLGDLAGGKEIMNYSGDGKIWNNFDGRIYISRVKNQWQVTIGQYDYKNNRHHSRFTAHYFDAKLDFAQPVAKIQVHMAKHTDRPTTNMLLDTMRVWKINNVTRPSIPYIIESGDVVEVDTATGGIYKNGIVWMDELDPVSEFFPIKPGFNPLALVPGDKATVSMTYRKRWL